MTATYIALATVTLSSGATAATFSSIPNTYRDLIVVVNAGRTSGGDAPYLRLNGDSAANYTWVNMWGRNNTTGSQTQGSLTSFIPMGFQAFLFTAFDFLSIAQIMDYSATNKHKTVLTRANKGSGDSGVEAIAGRWASNTAVNSVTITNLGSAQAGSTISLYGIN